MFKFRTDYKYCPVCKTKKLESQGDEFYCRECFYTWQASYLKGFWDGVKDSIQALKHVFLTIN